MSATFMSCYVRSALGEEYKFKGIEQPEYIHGIFPPCLAEFAQACAMPIRKVSTPTAKPNEAELPSTWDGADDLHAITLSKQSTLTSIRK